MKFQKISKFAALIVAVVVAFAFAPISGVSVKRTCTLFSFTGTPGTGEEYDPTKYVLFSGTFNPTTNCPSTAAKVCVICINAGEIYTQSDVNSLGIPQNWVGKPKVDQDTFTTNILDDSIASAISTLTDPLTDASGNIIYLRV